MRFSDQLRQSAEEHQAAAKSLLPFLEGIRAIKADLEHAASSLPVNDQTPHITNTRETILELVRRLPSGQGEMLVQAVTGMVMAKMYWLVADQLEYLIGKNMLSPPKSDSAQKRHELNNQLRMATVKGFSDGDWRDFDSIADRLRTGEPAAGSTPENAPAAGGDA